MALKHRRHALHQFIVGCQIAFAGGIGVYGARNYLDRDITKPKQRENLDYDMWTLLIFWLKGGKKD